MDPLRPFSDLIRALRSPRARSAARAAGAAAPRAAHPEQASPAATGGDSGLVALRAEIGTRLRQVGLADPHRAREAFVETVMARELGLGSAPCPELAEIARGIAARIGSHPRLSERLHAILTALAEGRPVE